MSYQFTGVYFCENNLFDLTDEEKAACKKFIDDYMASLLTEWLKLGLQGDVCHDYFNCSPKPPQPF